MPEQVELRVVVGARGKGGLMVGDLVPFPGTKGLDSIVRVEEKTKWCYVYAADSKRARFPLDAEVNVTREVPTPEEDLNDRIEQFAKRAIKDLEDAKSATMRCFNQLTTRFEEDRKKGHVYVFDIERALKVAQAECTEAIWKSIEVEWVDLMDKGVKVNTALLRAVAMQQGRAILSLTSPHEHRVLSRSTSLAGNLLEDLKRQAWAEFLYGFRYGYDAADLLKEMGSDDE